MADTSNRGLGSDKMDEQKKQEIQSAGGTASSEKQDMSELGEKGGQARKDQGADYSELGRMAHEKGNAHEFNSEEAREAGKQSHKNDQ